MMAALGRSLGNKKEGQREGVGQGEDCVREGG